MPKRMKLLEITNSLADILDFPNEGEEAAFYRQAGTRSRNGCRGSDLILCPRGDHVPPVS
jgi:hypothetical protein